MSEIYLFSGLGADKRVFENLSIEGYKLNFIEWTEPQKSETIEKYASGIAKQITTKAPVFIGVSFGGMMALEVAKFIKPAKLILISSAKSKSEIPFIYKLAGNLHVHQLIPASVLKSANPFTYYFFGAKQKKTRQLLKQILNDTDPAFLKWAIDKIIKWENTVVPKNALHIHGSSDKILPLKRLKADIVIDAGGHLMIVEQAKQISEEIINILSED